MTTSFKRGGFTFTCDSCGEEIEITGHRGNVASAWQEARDGHDWRAYKEGEDWQHACDGCRWQGQSDYPHDRW